MRRVLLVAALLGAGLVGHGTAARAAAPAGIPNPCPQRLLILSAMPVEVEPLLKAATLDPAATKEVNGRKFFVGSLRGNKVVIAMTGIGRHNAEQATTDAFAAFKCGKRPAIRGVVFSGVAGGAWIGDVTVVDKWTEDGKTFTPVDPTMLATAQQVAQSGRLQLRQDAGAGDPACACADPHAATVVTIEHKPELVVGGAGYTSDPFGERRLPCFPGGGDVFGCESCTMRATSPSTPDVVRFGTGIAPFLDPAFFAGYDGSTHDEYQAQDMESGAVARVAAAHGKPFIAFRGVSDGQGDPLGLPGFPFQFFAYRQISADNAATATLAFLEAWAAR